MANVNEKEYAYLWDGSSPGWVVVIVDDGHCSIYNIKNHIHLLIEDERMLHSLCEKMVESGCEVFEEKDMPLPSELTVIQVESTKEGIKDYEGGE